MTPILWHNPRCSKSRQTLKLLEEKGVAIKIRPYLKDTPGADEIRDALQRLSMAPIDLIRTGEKTFRDAGLNKDTPEGDLIEAMAEHPILIERPILFTDKGAAIGRPPEAVLDIL